MNIFLTQLLAQEINNPALPTDLGSLTGSEFFGRLIPALISFGLVIGAIFFIFYLIYGGIQWISSGGDKVQMESARSKITNALIGIIVLFAFFAILNLVECFFGIGLRQFEVGPFQINFSSSPFCPAAGGSPPPDVCSEMPPGCAVGCPVCDPSTGWSCDASMTPPCPI